MAERKFRNFSCTVALFTVSFSHLHYNVIQGGSEAISGENYGLTRNCLAYMVDFTVMQMSKVNCEKGYYEVFTVKIAGKDERRKRGAQVLFLFWLLSVESSAGIQK